MILCLDPVPVQERFRFKNGSVRRGQINGHGSNGSVQERFGSCGSGSVPSFPAIWQCAIAGTDIRCKCGLLRSRCTFPDVTYVQGGRVGVDSS